VYIPQLRDNVFIAKKNTICRMKSGNKLLDFAGPGLNVYQVTVSDNHTMNTNGLIELFLASGHLTKDKVGNVVEARNANGMELIRYYWVICQKELLG
jgi:hypothetical protein